MYRVGPAITKALLFTGLLCCAQPAFAGPEEEYFEVNVRPLLAKRCFDCHGEKKQESEVRMDVKAAVIGGGTAGPLVTPGKVAESRLWQVLQHSDSDVQMPPDAKMPPEELAVIKTWIERGAYWPDDGKSLNALGSQPRKADGSFDFVEAVKQHWAYQPVKNVPVPETKQAATCLTPIDRFIAAKQDEKNLKFSPMASRETLIRRIAMDLVGVPPTMEEVQQFVQDKRPDALNLLIDQYLADPRYGERWGRHWLDVARYADTKGYVFTENRFYPFSYTYRDYVVQSLNQDVPYNQFILEQLAADQLKLAENDPRLAALGFLTVGNRFLNRMPDIIDDRIDVVTRGILGMTVACARCHDHKYDAIPTADYYSLYGVFNSSYEPELGPVLGTPDETTDEYKAFKAGLDERQKKLDDFISSSHETLLTGLTDSTANSLLGAARLLDLIPKDNVPFEGKEPRLKQQERWKNYISERTKANPVDPVWRAWKILMAIPDKDLAAAPAEKLKPVLEDKEIPAALKKILEEAPPKSHLEVAQAYGKCLTPIVEEWKKAKAATPPLEALADAEQERLRKTLFGPGSVSDIPGGEKSFLFERDQVDRIRTLRAEINGWYAKSSGAPARAMVMLDKEKPSDGVIFIRGDVNRRGAVVKRHSPRLLEPEAEVPYDAKASGRLDLAKAIISEKNPLTARVIVNRVWGLHFGVPLVESTSDFGSRAADPSHPELLDYLAWTFMHEDKWSLKSLHRRIMRSHAYLQASNDNPAAVKIDSQNTLLWRQNRQRMSFEAIRDSMLAVSGQLESRQGGRPSAIDSPDLAKRRTIYALIDRNNLPGLFRTFDYPSPDASSPGRPLTTVPQQALFMMNSDFVQSASKQLSEKVRSQWSDPDQQAKAMLESVLARPARPEEIRLLSSYLEKHPLEQLAQALLMTNEFLFVD